MYCDKQEEPLSVSHQGTPHLQQTRITPYCVAPTLFLNSLSYLPRHAQSPHVHYDTVFTEKSGAIQTTAKVMTKSQHSVSE